MIILDILALKHNIVRPAGDLDDTGDEESYSPKTSPKYEPLFDSSAARRQKAEEEFLEKEQELLSE